VAFRPPIQQERLPVPNGAAETNAIQSALSGGGHGREIRSELERPLRVGQHRYGSSAGWLWSWVEAVDVERILCSNVHKSWLVPLLVSDYWRSFRWGECRFGVALLFLRLPGEKQANHYLESTNSAVDVRRMTISDPWGKLELIPVTPRA